MILVEDLGTVPEEGHRRYGMFKCPNCEDISRMITYNAVNSKTGLCKKCSYEQRIHGNLKHGEYQTRLYKIWNGMRQRCNGKTNKAYEWYGAQGVHVCNEWNDFLVFKEWSMTNGYTEELVITRRGDTGNYEPSNCVWKTKAENAAEVNTREKDGTGTKINNEALDAIIEQDKLNLKTKKDLAMEYGVTIGTINKAIRSRLNDPSEMQKKAFKEEK